jgi:hypothetical protein
MSKKPASSPRPISRGGRSGQASPASTAPTAFLKPIGARLVTGTVGAHVGERRTVAPGPNDRPRSRTK